MADTELLKEIESIIDTLKSKNKAKQIDCKSLSTDKCKMLWLILCDNPNSYSFGKMYGYFEYENQIYKFTWHIHKPNQRIASLSNRMTSFGRMSMADDYGIRHIAKKPSETGHKAFWLYTPDSMLNGFDYDLRQLMHSIKVYAVKEQLCKHIRKFDKQYLRFMAEH